MDFITSQLAVGSREDAENSAALAAHGIDTLLSLAPLARPVGVARQFSLALPDRVALPGALIDEACNFLLDQTARGRRVLVHCEMGISRSPTIAAAYLHLTQGVDLGAALRSVRAARPVAEPHPALIASLFSHFGTLASHADLSGNENPLGPSPHALAAMHRVARQVQRYPDKDGSALRTRLGQRCGVAASQIVLGNGASELIDLAARALLQPGDEMLLPSPAFPSYRAAALRAHAKLVTVPMPGGHCDVDALIGHITPATRLVVVVTPHNPCGTVLPCTDLARLLAALPRQACLLVDEAYREFADAGELPDLLSLFSGEQRLFVIRSLSKAYGLAGLRIGYGIARPALAARLDALRQPFNTGSLAQTAALAALDDDEHLARSVAHNSAGRDCLERGLAALGIEFTPSQANFVLFHAGPQGVEALAARGVLVKCMARFGLPAYARVSVGRAADNARFLAALAEIRVPTTAAITHPAYA
jgi:histidinol-phosphate aminotransferase